MKICLTSDQVKKVLATLSTETIEQALDANWNYWNVTCGVDGDGLELTKDVKRDK